MKALTNAPKTISIYNEILVQYAGNLAPLWNGLKAEERVFIYYLWRASLPGNRILTDQIHRHGLQVRDIFRSIYQGRHKLGAFSAEFVEEVKTFLIYLETNHGQYFQREMSHEKRTPRRLGLTKLTKENLKKALEELGHHDLSASLDSIASTLFDESYEPTNTVPGDIAKSSVNFYPRGFSNEEYEKLPAEQRSRLNACFERDPGSGKVKMRVYSAQDKYAIELSVSLAWIEKAYELAQRFSKTFDAHLQESLRLLAEFLRTGDEEMFRAHSIEWLKSSSKIDYNFGFIEVYKDPQGVRGSFQAEATIKTLDISALNAILPSLERKLPFPDEFKRESLDSALPNASINTMVFGTGEHGPMQTVAAYALPNYEDIRSKHGTKQIIYPTDKPIGELLNAELRHKLFFSKEHQAWFAKHDPEMQFLIDLWDAHVILHETLGHGSGRLATHTFKKGESLTVEGAVYNVGDTIAVTGANNAEFLAGYESTLEELRAEIIALYTSIEHLDELIKVGLLEKWVKKLGAGEVKKWLVLEMAGSLFRRYLQQADDAQEIAGDHARANATISEYLLAHGGIEIVEETCELEKRYTVFDMRITDFELVFKNIKELMIEVQRIKSTGDGLAVKKLVDTYGKPIRVRILAALKENNKKVVGNIKARVAIYPHFEPIIDSDSKIIFDIEARWPSDIAQQIESWARLELHST